MKFRPALKPRRPHTHIAYTVAWTTRSAAPSTCQSVAKCRHCRRRRRESPWISAGWSRRSYVATWPTHSNYAVRRRKSSRKGCRRHNARNDRWVLDGFRQGRRRVAIAALRLAGAGLFEWSYQSCNCEQKRRNRIEIGWRRCE